MVAQCVPERWLPEQIPSKRYIPNWLPNGIRPGITPLQRMRCDQKAVAKFGGNVLRKKHTSGKQPLRIGRKEAVALCAQDVELARRRPSRRCTPKYPCNGMRQR